MLITGLTNGTGYTVAMRAVSDGRRRRGIDHQRRRDAVRLPDRARSDHDRHDSPANGALLVSWAAPNNNGSAITSYTATAFTLLTTAASGRHPCTTTAALSCTITGLRNGTTYYVSLQATNAAGASARSDPRVAGTPAAVPNAPTASDRDRRRGQVALTWTAPANNGIGDHRLQDLLLDRRRELHAVQRRRLDRHHATVTGLTNGTAYTFEVAAVNANGTGPLSSAVVVDHPARDRHHADPVDRHPDQHRVHVHDHQLRRGDDLHVRGDERRDGDAERRTVTVTGLAPGASSTVTVTAAKTGFTTTTAPVTGRRSRPAPRRPSAPPRRPLDGLTVLITNYDTAATYTIDHRRPGQSRSAATSAWSRVGPGAGRIGDGHRDRRQDAASRTRRRPYTGSALAAGTAPTFSV